MLNETFYALGDPTRRAIVVRLAKSEGISVGELARPFASSLPAIIKHLDVLHDAGLVSRTRSGRNVICVGKSSVTLVVGDLGEQVRELRKIGVDVGDSSRTDYVATAIVKDPDGNQAVLAEALDAKNRAAR